LIFHFGPFPKFLEVFFVSKKEEEKFKVWTSKDKDRLRNFPVFKTIKKKKGKEIKQ
jgi:hypothetical protein